MIMLNRLGDLFNGHAHTTVTVRRHEDLFYKIRRMVKNRIPEIRVPCPFRQKMIKRILTDLMKGLEERCLYVRDTDIGEFSEQELYAFWRINLDIAFDSMQSDALQNGVPMEALTIFMDNMNPIKDSLYTVIRKTCSSTYVYGSNGDKQQAVFNAVSCFVDSLVSCFEQTSRTLNGELNRAMSRAGHWMSCRHCRDDCEYRKMEELSEFTE